MQTPPATAVPSDTSHSEYAMAFADLERRAARGEFTLAQWRHEVHALRQRYTAGLGNSNVVRSSFTVS